MIKKHKVILFLKNNARIITTDKPGVYKGVPHVAVDPDLSQVKGHPPHYWKLSRGKVLPVSNVEKIRRDLMTHKWGKESADEFIVMIRRAIILERAKTAALMMTVVILMVLASAYMTSGLA